MSSVLCWALQSPTLQVLGVDVTLVWSVAVSHQMPSGDGGIVVSIAAFQAVDPGSIPGHRSFLFAYLHAVKCVFLG